MDKEIPKRHINLKFSLKKNREFLSKLYNSTDLEDVRKWFDKQDCSVSWARQADNEMTIEAFLKIPKLNHVVLQISWQEPIISYAIRTGDTVENFAWIQCPASEHNYKIVSELFQKVFNKSLEDYN